MGARYPDQVGGHKPCEPVVKLSFVPGPSVDHGHDGGRFVLR